MLTASAQLYHLPQRGTFMQRHLRVCALLILYFQWHTSSRSGEVGHNIFIVEPRCSWETQKVHLGARFRGKNTIFLISFTKLLYTYMFLEVNFHCLKSPQRRADFKQSTLILHRLPRTQIMTLWGRDAAQHYYFYLFIYFYHSHIVERDCRRCVPLWKCRSNSAKGDVHIYGDQEILEMAWLMSLHCH